MKEVFKPPYDMEKFPLAVQDIILKEAEFWPAVGIVRRNDNGEADADEIFPTDWWQIIFSRGMNTGMKIYDLWYHGSSKVPDIHHVSVVDDEALKIVQEVA